MAILLITVFGLLLVQPTNFFQGQGSFVSTVDFGEDDDTPPESDNNDFPQQFSEEEEEKRAIISACHWEESQSFESPYPEYKINVLQVEDSILLPPPEIV